MLRITKQADYGFVLLIQIAGGTTTQGSAAVVDSAMHNARDLAEETGLPLPMVSKILKALARAGVLASHRGIKGGYSLAREAAAITAVEIITALDGPIRVSECLGEDAAERCDYEVRCPVKPSWQRLNTAIRDALEKITLAEMALNGGCCGGNGHGAADEFTRKRMKIEKPRMGNAKPGIQTAGSACGTSNAGAQRIEI